MSTNPGPNQAALSFDFNGSGRPNSLFDRTVCPAIVAASVRVEDWTLAETFVRHYAASETDSVESERLSAATWRGLPPPDEARLRRRTRQETTAVRATFRWNSNDCSSPVTITLTVTNNRHGDRPHRPR